jgi:hypothetical protein
MAFRYSYRSSALARESVICVPAPRIADHPHEPNEQELQTTIHTSYSTIQLASMFSRSAHFVPSACDDFEQWYIGRPVQTNRMFKRYTVLRSWGRLTSSENRVPQE